MTQRMENLTKQVTADKSFMYVGKDKINITSEERS